MVVATTCRQRGAPRRATALDTFRRLRRGKPIAKPPQGVAPLLGMMVGVLAGGRLAGLPGGLAGAVVAVGFLLLVKRFGLAAPIFALTLFIIAPAAVGEGAFSLTLLSLVLQLLVLLLVQPQRHAFTDTVPFRTAAFVIPMLVAATFFLRVDGMSFMFGAFLLTSFNTVLLCSRPQLVRDSLLVIALVTGGFTLSYLASIATGFVKISALQLGNRPVGLYLPATFTTAGQELLPTPRMALLVGEPGLNVFYLIAAAAGVLTCAVSIRWLCFPLALLAVLFGQSTGVMLTGGAALIVGIVMSLLRRHHYLLVFSSLMISAAVGPWIVKAAIAAKASNNTLSLSDRGLASAGASGPTAGEVNLLTTWGLSPAGALPMVIALLILGALALRTVRGTGFWVTFALTVIFLQPTMWMCGAWMMIIMALIASENHVRPEVPPTAAVSSPATHLETA